MLCALIMAGGKGTRFWPLSTEEKPKQFLNLIGESTMIQLTINRIKPIIPIKRIFVCTAEKYVDLVKEQLPELPERNIIVEPEGRNTAPCITLSAFVIKRYYKNSNMVVLPSDHLIIDEEKFRKIVQVSNEFINKNKDALITLGMNPIRPETDYGYIKWGGKVQVIDEQEVIKVDSFVEKPSREKAEDYLKEGNYLWNGGIFLWNIDNILRKIKKFSNVTYRYLREIERAKEKNIQKIINRNYKSTESISIDYAVLEKSRDIYVIRSDIGWDDVGNWESIDRYKNKDKDGNISMAITRFVDAKNNMIVSENNEVIVHDIENIYLIECNGKIIVGKRENISGVKGLRNN